MRINQKKSQVFCFNISSFILLIVMFIHSAEAKDANIKRDSQLTESQIFSNIYLYDIWGGGSGGGSSPENALPYMSMLKGVFLNDSIKTIVDLGCGDWQLMEKIKVPRGKLYKGYDLVESVIEANKAKHAAENIHFFKIENINDFINVKADLLVVKDVIQHWPNEQVKFFLQKVLPNFKYALITNDYEKNFGIKDIESGGFRPIDLYDSHFEEISRKMNIRFFMDYPSHGIIKRVYIFENTEPFVFH